MLFIVLFAAQCSNPPGRKGLPTVYHPVPTLQWTAQGQGHHTGQEVSTHKENTKHSSKTCIHSVYNWDQMLYAGFVLKSILLLWI